MRRPLNGTTFFGGGFMGMETGWLSFWRVKAGKKVDPPATYDALQGRKEPAALEDVPVDDILAEIKRQYPTFHPENEVEVDVPEEEAAFLPEWNKKHFRFTFYGNPERQMDRVVELMTRFGLACYDAGTKTMYSVEEPPPSFQGTPEDQAFVKALDKTLSTAAAEARAAATDPQDRLRRLKAFVDSGGMQAALEEEMKRSQPKQKKT